MELRHPPGKVLALAGDPTVKSLPFSLEPLPTVTSNNKQLLQATALLTTTATTGTELRTATTGTELRTATTGTELRTATTRTELQLLELQLPSVKPGTLSNHWLQQL
jgi:hypothetical protein